MALNSTENLTPLVFRNGCGKARFPFHLRKEGEPAVILDLDENFSNINRLRSRKALKALSEAAVEHLILSRGDSRGNLVVAHPADEDGYPNNATDPFHVLIPSVNMFSRKLISPHVTDMSGVALSFMDKSFIPGTIPDIFDPYYLDELQGIHSRVRNRYQ